MWTSSHGRICPVFGAFSNAKSQSLWTFAPSPWMTGGGPLRRRARDAGGGGTGRRGESPVGAAEALGAVAALAVVVLDDPAAPLDGGALPGELLLPRRRSVQLREPEHRRDDVVQLLLAE